MAILGVGTALTAASTIANAHSAATGDETSGTVGMALGIAAFVASAPAIAHGAYKGVQAITTKLAQNAGKSLAKTAVSSAKELGIPMDKAFRIPRPTVLKSGSSNTPASSPAIARTIGTQTTSPAVASVPQASSSAIPNSLLTSLKSGKALRQTPVTAAPDAVNQDQLLFVAMNRGKSKLDEAGNLVNTGGLKRANELAGSSGINTSEVISNNFMRAPTRSGVRQ